MFNQRIRALRMKRHFTQQQMADRLSITIVTYQKYEQGTREPSFTTLVKIADILAAPTDYLLGRDEFLDSLGVCVEEYR